MVSNVGASSTTVGRSRKFGTAATSIAYGVAIAPKSDAAYQALNRVMEVVESTMAEPVPFRAAGAVVMIGIGLAATVAALAVFRRRDLIAA